MQGQTCSNMPCVHMRYDEILGKCAHSNRNCSSRDRIRSRPCSNLHRSKTSFRAGLQPVRQPVGQSVNQWTSDITGAPVCCCVQPDDNVRLIQPNTQAVLSHNL